MDPLEPKTAPYHITIGSQQIRRQCPLWVISRHVQCKEARPLYPNSDRESRHAANGHVRFTPESGHVQRNS